MRAATSISGDPAATAALARRLGRALRGGEVVALSGPLGAGKTTFAKGLAEGLDIDPRDVTSPTFLLVHELSGRLRLLHADAYRIRSGGELADLGVGDAMGGEGVVLLEWPERCPDLLPADHLAVRLTPGATETERRIDVVATGPRHAPFVDLFAERAAGTPGAERPA